nr:MAG TPA: Helix-turn-helix XRE-family like protein [Bacteriophage sp.]
MNERIKALRKELGLTQEQFAQRVGLTKNYISLVENGSRSLAPRTVGDICREFNVNEAWLRDGIGEPHTKQSWEEEVAQFVFSTFQSEEESFQKDLLRVLARLPLDQWEVLGNIAKQLYLEQQKREKEKES